MLLASTYAIFIEALVLLTVPCPKISTSLKKLAPTGWHGWHVFATLYIVQLFFPLSTLHPPCRLCQRQYWSKFAFSLSIFLDYYIFSLGSFKSLIVFFYNQKDNYNSCYILSSINHFVLKRFIKHLIKRLHSVVFFRDMTQLQMFQKVEYGWGLIFKVVLEC